MIKTMKQKTKSRKTTNMEAAILNLAWYLDRIKCFKTPISIETQTIKLISGGKYSKVKHNITKKIHRKQRKSAI